LIPVLKHPALREIPQHNLDLDPGDGDVSWVKSNTLGRIFSAVGFSIGLMSCPSFLNAASTPATAEVIPLSDHTFTLTHTAKTAFSRDTEKLKAKAQEEAAKYCAAQGKEMKVVSLTSEKPFFSTGYPTATIVFKALSPGEMEQVPDVSTTLQTPSKPDGTGDLYTDILKLDDLRKKGLLTDKEFQSEKKKVLSRSK
jgi:hypothetical protein